MFELSALVEIAFASPDRRSQSRFYSGPTSSERKSSEHLISKFVMRPKLTVGPNPVVESLKFSLGIFRY